MILCHHISAGWSVSPINLYSNHKKKKIESNNVLVNSTNRDRLFITLPTSTYLENSQNDLWDLRKEKNKK